MAVRQEEYLLWDASEGGVRIERLHDHAFDPARWVRTAHFVNPDSVARGRVGLRPVLGVAYAAARDAGAAAVTPRPGTWGSHVLSDLDEDTVVRNTAVAEACEGMELAFEIDAAGAWNVSWEGDLSGTGGALSVSALAANQVLCATFCRQVDKWWLQGAVRVA